MMTRKILITPILVFFSFISFAQQKNDSIELIQRPADIGLIYPISTNGVNAAHYSNKVSLQVIAGVSGAITGCAFAGIANIIKYNATGAQFAGIVNLIGDQAKSAQFAGIMNAVKKETMGLQAAGLINKAGSVKGIQVAGLGNISKENCDGLQIAGLFNQSHNTTSQIAGLINKAEKVKGVQISGLLNIADSSDYPIGIINLVKNGEKRIGISTDETLTTLLSFRSGGRVLYGILAIGYNLKSDDELYALEGGIGAHLWSSDRFRINIEGTQLYLDDFEKGSYFKSSFSILPALEINDHFEIFAGPNINYVNYKRGKGDDLVSHYLWNNTTDHGHFNGLYVGGKAGITFKL